MSDYHYCRWRDLLPPFPPPTARNADPPDPAAELAEALRSVLAMRPELEAAAYVDFGPFDAARAALAKWEKTNA